MAGFLLAFGGIIRAQQSNSLPHLAANHGATQIIVDGKPFLVRGGELENSSASSLSYMETVWPKIVALHCNTVLAPAYWRLVEPQEGKFDFTTVDGLIRGARQHHVRLALLWFGSWKNSMSSYVPDWVKENQQRFPRAVRDDGTSLEILSALSPNNLAADSNAFVALMRHLKEFDSADHTVILVQVENEVGMIPEARDHSAAANAAFLSPVPAELTSYLSKTRIRLSPRSSRRGRRMERRQVRIGQTHSALDPRRMNCSPRGRRPITPARSRPGVSKSIRCPCTSMPL